MIAGSTARVIPWRPRDDTRPRSVFQKIVDAVAEDEAADPRPTCAMSAPAFVDWWKRHLEREALRLEALEANALTTDPDDLCPLAREGLKEFLAWARRQDERRRQAR